LGPQAKEKLLQYVSLIYPSGEIYPTSEPFQEALNQLEAYFAGELFEFDLKLSLQGTPFQRSVWTALQTIPYGKTVSYGHLAKQLNTPGGMRAVGAANGQNPIPIIIPCHRVIASDGSLGGYTGGLEIKHQLLEMERQKTTPTLF